MPRRRISFADFTSELDAKARIAGHIAHYVRANVDRAPIVYRNVPSGTPVAITPLDPERGESDSGG